MKRLATFPDADRVRILTAVETLKTNWTQGDIEKIRGEENTWRSRVGAYRVFFELMSADRVIAIMRIERRMSKTYHKRH